ncbi:hypothetical protein [Ideonella sp. A 288]|uniref:hypothetical protein n=1 Tax=Ideonella sp. A 288 TaxID=1962181 RepID=UPI000B4B3BC7|nr:hypothetical protein [Ideonella sp. A 288]
MNQFPFSLKSLAKAAATGAVAVCSLAAHAQSTDAPTTISNSRFDIDAVMSEVKSESKAGEQLTGKLNAGYSLFSIGGEFGKAITAMSTTTRNGVADVGKGVQMSGTTVNLKAVMNKVDNTGGEVANGVAQFGKP